MLPKNKKHHNFDLIYTVLACLHIRFPTKLGRWEVELQETMKSEEQWQGKCQLSCLAVLLHIIGAFLFKVLFDSP